MPNTARRESIGNSLIEARDATRAAARDYLDRGWKPLPIPNDEKRPRLSNWQSEDISHDNLKQYFDRWNANIGVQLGSVSNGLCDVDLDCEEARKLAPHFLPSTNAKFGRRSSPASHWLYYTEAWKTAEKAVVAFDEPQRSRNAGEHGVRLLEFRTGRIERTRDGEEKVIGAVSMIPPSKHPNGEQVRWEAEGEPAEVPTAKLRRDVAELAAATLLARHYPDVGKRNDAALVLGGFLARIDMAAEDIEAFVRAVADVADDEQAAERGRSAARAVERLQEGRDTPGLPRMREVWGEEVADTAAKWLGVRTASSRTVSNEEPPVVDGDAVMGQLIVPYGAPVAAADAFVERYHLRGEIPLLRHYRGAFYFYTGTHYRLHREDVLERDLYAFLKDVMARKPNGDIVPYNPTKTKVAEVVHALRRSALLVPEEWEAPFWLAPLGEPLRYRPANNLVAASNGILNLTTRELTPHNPLFFIVNCLPFDYDPEAPTPERFYRFLDSLCLARDEKQTLQEIFGYLLTSDTRQQKIFLIVGPKRGGKGTLVFLLEQLLGSDNIAFQTLDSLTNEFGRWPLIDKKLAVFADARLGSRGNIHRLVETLLSISGGDPQTINRKYGTFWNGRLLVRFLITTNVLPALKDSSGTIASRFILLMLTKSFYGKEDLKLQSKLARELPSILNWALDGLQRLREYGHFQQPAASQEAIELLEHLAAPIFAFVQEWCRVDSEAHINVKRLYQAYRDWADDTGQSPLRSHMFGKELREVVRTLKTTGHGARRSYQGITLSEEGRLLWVNLQQEKGRSSAR